MEMCKFEVCITGFQPQTPNANHANSICTFSTQCCLSKHLLRLPWFHYQMTVRLPRLVSRTPGFTVQPWLSRSSL